MSTNLVRPATQKRVVAATDIVDASDNADATENADSTDNTDAANDDIVPTRSMKRKMENNTITQAFKKI